MAFGSYSMPAVEAEKRQVRASKNALSLGSPPEVGRLLLGGKKDGGVGGEEEGPNHSLHNFPGY